MRTTLTPLGDRVLIEVVNIDDLKTKHIVVPDHEQDNIMYGIVRDVSPGYYDSEGRVVTQHLTVGSEVLISPDCGSRVEVEGALYYLVRENEVLGALRL
jgi:chaperonin GroES